MNSGMGRSRSSISKAASLRPELEFEVIKLTLLRESYIKRLAAALDALRKELDIGIVGLVDVLRDTSIQVVETIITWERAQVNYPNTTPYMWNGEEYLHKMLTDMDQFAYNKQLQLWLGFSLLTNPFFVPQEVYIPTFSLAKQSYVVFGIPPHKRASNINDPNGLAAMSSLKKDSAKVSTWVQSPYNTPIINDTKLLPSASVTRAKALIKQRKIDAANAAAGIGEKEEIGANVYETYVSHETITRVRKAFTILCDRYGANTTFLSQFMSTSTANISAVGSRLASVAELNNNNSVEFLEQEQQDGETVEQNASFANDQDMQIQDTNSSARVPQEDSFVTAPDQELLSGTGSQVETSSAASKRIAKNAFLSGLDATAGITTDIANNKFMRIKYLDSSNNEMNNTSLLDPNASQVQLHASGSTIGGQTYGLPSVTNTTMRFGVTDIATQPFVWTAHDVKLHRAVHRKGGELFTLTAAGTQGRMKAPHRKSRLERLQVDLDRVIQQRNILEMSLEDRNIGEFLSEASKVVKRVAPVAKLSEAEEIALKLAKRVKKGLTEPDVVSVDLDSGPTLLHPIILDIDYLKQTKKGYDDMEYFLKYQLDAFKVIMHSDINKDQRYLKSLRESQIGAAVLSDEKLSMELENRMAGKIQSIVRRKFGRKVRAAINKKHYIAARAIQGAFRRYSKKKASELRVAGTRLAMYLQKLFRSKQSQNLMKILVDEARVRRAVLVIQRIVRGFIGRKRIVMKREFAQCISAAQKAVSAHFINNSTLEELCEAIDYFVSDYRMDLPIGVITVLRGILFMFLANSHETISTHQSGYYKPVFLRASNCSYQTCLQILRRKGRFMRRLRCLANSVCAPGARKLPFNNKCQTHLEALVEHVKESDFDSMEKGKTVIVSLYRYCCALKRAFELQQHFSEFFCKSLPNWFRKVMRVKVQYEKTRLAELVAESCCQQVMEHRAIFSKRGMKWKAISVATEKSNTDLSVAQTAHAKVKKQFDYMMDKLNQEDAKKLRILQDMFRARTLGVDVARRDLEEYIRVSIVPLPAQVKSLSLNIEEKSFIALDAESSLEAAKVVIAEGLEARNFDSLFHFKKIHSACVDLGKTIADLYVLENRWDEFLHSIGGQQFLVDLTGNNYKEYQMLKTKALKLMARRRALMRKVDKGLSMEVEKVTTHIFNSITVRHWDHTTPQMEKAEIQEDRDCAKKEADIQAKTTGALDAYFIPLKPVKPIVLLLDRRIPRYSKKCIVNRLTTLEFVLAKCDQCDPKLAEEIQGLIDDKKNVIVMVDRGLHRQARFHFVTCFENIMGLLLPPPRVVALDATASFIFENWHSMFSTDFEEVNAYNVHESDHCCMALGKSRRIACLFELCLFHNSGNGFIDPVVVDDSMTASSSLTGTAAGNPPMHMRMHGARVVSAGDRAGSVEHITAVVENGEKNESDELEVMAEAEGETAPAPEKDEKVNRFSLWSGGDKKDKKQPANGGEAAAEPNPLNESKLDVVEGEVSAPPRKEEKKSRFSLWGNGDKKKEEKEKESKLTPVHTINELESAPTTVHVPLGADGSKEHTRKEEPPKNKAMGGFWGAGLLGGLTNLVSGQALEEQSVQESMASMATPLEPEHQHRSVLLSVWSQCSLSVTGFGAVTPVWFRDRCMADFQDFINELIALGDTRTSAASFNSASAGELSHLSTVENSGMVLAATIAALLDVWDASLLSWKEGEIMSGCTAFAMLAEDYNHFCDRLSLRELPVCNILKLRKIERAKELIPVWKTQYDHMSMTSHPARFLLSYWCLETIRLLELTCHHGGPANDQHTGSIEIMHPFEWTRDAYAHGAEEVIGKLLEECFENDLVWENKMCPSVAYLHKTDIENLQGQLVESLNCYRHVRVYHRDNNAYIATKMQQGDFLRIENARSVVDATGGGNGKTNKDATLSEASFASPAIEEGRRNGSDGGTDDGSWFHFRRLSMGKVVASLRPTATEMFEGRPPHYDLGTEEKPGKDLWYKHLSEWTKVDNIGDEFEVSSIRKRDLQLSRLGFLDGYHCRLEIFEERAGEMLILVHGILKHRLLKFLFTKKVLNELLFICDEDEEKEKLEAVDVHAMAGICSDRLRISPSARWSSFLQYNAFAPACADRFLEKSRARLSMRLKHGPGRHAGARAVRVAGMMLIVSIYEIANEGDTHTLRIEIYEPLSSQAAEYRVSPMERAMMFTDDKPIFEQIVHRLMVSYCDTAQRSRTLLKLNAKFKPNVSEWQRAHPKSEDEVAAKDDDKYTIVTKSIRELFGGSVGSNQEEEEEENDIDIDVDGYGDDEGVHAPESQMFYGGGDNESIAISNKDDQEDSLSALRPGEHNFSYSIGISAVGSSPGPGPHTARSGIAGVGQQSGVFSHGSVASAAPREGLPGLSDQSSSMISSYQTDVIQQKSSTYTLNMESESILDDPNRKLHKIQAESTIDSVREDAVQFATWGWAVYFDRSTISKMVGGNIKCSMGLNMQREGFYMYARDNVTFFEHYRFLTYEEACELYYDKAISELQLELATNVDDSVVFDLVDDLLTTVDVEEVEDQDNYHRLVFVSEKDDEIKHTIGILKQGGDEDDSTSRPDSDGDGDKSGEESESDAESKNLEEDAQASVATGSTAGSKISPEIRATLLVKTAHGGSTREGLLVLPKIAPIDGAETNDAIEPEGSVGGESLGSDGSSLISAESSVSMYNGDVVLAASPSAMVSDKDRSYFRIQSPLSKDQHCEKIKWKYNFPNWNHPLVTALEKMQGAGTSAGMQAIMGGSFHASDVEEENNRVQGVKFTCEKPSTYLIDKTTDLKEESRICWRGRVKPKNVTCAEAGAEETKKKAFQPVNSKVVMNKTLESMQVFAEYAYLKEHEKTATVTTDDLPICVKEVVSEGAGKMSRMYRIEVLTNSGMKFGHADIHDEPDLADVLGAGKAHLLKQGQRDLAAAFHYIAHERLSLNMMPMKRKKGVGGRREGVRAEAAGAAGAGAESLASLIRDSDLAKSALASGDVPIFASNAKGRGNLHYQDSDGSGGLKIDRNQQAESLGAEAHWVRIYVKTHRTSGRSFRTLVMMFSKDPEFWWDTNKYIESKTRELGLHGCFTSFTYQFKSFDNLGKHTKTLTLTGTELFGWLPGGYNLDCLKNTYRRRKFGIYLLQNLRVQYTSFEGDFQLEMVKRRRERPLDMHNVNFGSMSRPGHPSVVMKPSQVAPSKPSELVRESGSEDESEIQSTMLDEKPTAAVDVSDDVSQVTGVMVDGGEFPQQMSADDMDGDEAGDNAGDSGSAQLAVEKGAEEEDTDVMVEGAAVELPRADLLSNGWNDA